jgi:hypothetical protein
VVGIVICEVGVHWVGFKVWEFGFDDSGHQYSCGLLVST